LLRHAGHVVNSPTLTGIAVAASKHLSGWQRFAPLLQGLYYLIVLFLPVLISNQAPNLLAESFWQVTWILIGLALFTSTARTVINVEAAA
jgi:hypothetical protein